MESGLCLLVCPLGVVFVLFPEAMGAFDSGFSGRGGLMRCPAGREPDDS